MTKTRMRKAGHVAGMGEKKNEHRVLVGNSEEVDQLENLSVDGRVILKNSDRMFGQPRLRTLWKFEQIRIPSRYYETSASRKRESRMHMKEDIWIVICRPKSSRSRSLRKRDYFCCCCCCCCYCYCCCCYRKAWTAFIWARIGNSNGLL